MNSLVNNIRCKVGLHPFGEWKFIDSQDCNRTRTCTICGNVQQEVKHDWGRIGFVKDGNCEMLRRCKRCGEVKADSRRFEHDWSKSREDVPNETCVSATYCVRCHEEKEDSRETLHSFEESDYLSLDDCVVEKRCVKCGETEQATKHDMGNLYLIDNSCEATYGCKRCGYISKGIWAKGINEFNKIHKPHKWTDKDWVYVKPDDTTNCYVQRHCPRCGEFDKRILRHDWMFIDENECFSQQVCKRCKKVESNKANHRWSAWKPSANESCSETRYCTRCNANETRDTHSWNIEYLPSKEAAEGIGIVRLIRELQKNKSSKLMRAYAIQQRWQDRQDEKSQYGSNEMIRTELAQIKTSLTELALAELQVPFQELTGKLNFIHQENGLYIIVDKNEKRVQVCSKCGSDRYL